jgi:hypothetical protein
MARYGFDNENRPITPVGFLYGRDYAHGALFVLGAALIIVTMLVVFRLGLFSCSAHDVMLPIIKLLLPAAAQKIRQYAMFKAREVHECFLVQFYFVYAVIGYTYALSASVLSYYSSYCLNADKLKLIVISSLLSAVGILYGSVAEDPLGLVPLTLDGRGNFILREGVYFPSVFFFLAIVLINLMVVMKIQGRKARANREKL